MELRQRPRRTPPAARPPAGNDPQCLVVMYHYVHDHASSRVDRIPGLSLEEFTHQLDLLCRTLEPVTWPALYAWTCGRKAIPRRSFLLTFDDGLACHARVVAPLLKERGLRGTFFVSGSTLREYRLLPAHALHLLLATLGDGMLEREVHQVLAELAPGQDWSADDGEAAAMYAYESPARAVLKHLLNVRLPRDLRDRVLANLFERHVGSQARWAKSWYLDWDDVVALEADGHTLGGHGYAHEPYARLTDNECHSDVANVAALLAEGLGPDLRPFSYPFGSVTDAAAEACAANGFVHAFTTRCDQMRAGDERMRLPRVDTIDVGAVLEEC